MSHYYNPVRIIKTEHWHNELINSIENLKISSPVIITSPGNRKRLNLDSKFDYVFSDMSSNPTFDDCINVIKFCQKKMFDGVVALGGGSPMDLAKVVMAHLSLGKTNIQELIDYKGTYHKEIPSIFLPTTHGTASEVTMWGTLWNMREKKKCSISHPNLYPSIAILDGNLTLSLPLDISISTTMDALSHSFESIWNKNSNLTSTNYAIDSICLILRNIDYLKLDPFNIQARTRLLYASNLAGLAFSNTKTAAAHSISYPLTIYYGIPHGIASSICLPSLLKLNRKSIQHSLDIICEKNNINFQQLIEKIKSIPYGVVSYKLIDWGIKEYQIDELVEKSFASERMGNNIVNLSRDIVSNIFREIYN